jgi:hypothetical protein
MCFTNQTEVAVSVEVVVLLDKDHVVVGFVWTKFPDGFEVALFEVFLLKFKDHLIALFQLSESVHEDAEVRENLLWCFGVDILGDGIHVSDFMSHKSSQEFAIVCLSPVRKPRAQMSLELSLQVFRYSGVAFDDLRDFLGKPLGSVVVLIKLKLEDLGDRD